ncbi:hypothetical protein [Paenibacillus phytorum]|nr:hypothetical protein [Paenibacillus phytorum]
MIKMVQEQLYNNCALIIADTVNHGNYRTPNEELSIDILVGHIVAYQ